MAARRGVDGDHELGSPSWVRSRDFEQFPAGGGYEVQCSCGWRGPVRTTTALAWIAATGHLAEMLGPDAVHAAPPLASAGTSTPSVAPSAASVPTAAR